MPIHQLPGPKLPPQDLVLLGILEDVLCDWAFLAAEPIGKPAEGPADLPLEMHLAFSGEREGRLVLRSSPDFGRRLAEGALGEGGADEESAKDAMAELCNLVGKHLASRTLSGEGARMQASVPESSHPGAWPATAPAQSVALIADGEPFEARVWIWKPGPSASPGQAS